MVEFVLTPAGMKELAAEIAKEVVKIQREAGFHQQPATAPVAPPAVAPVPVKMLFSEREAAEQLGIAAVTLKKWRLDGKVKPYTATRPIRYRPQDIQAIAEWMHTESEA